MFFILLHFRTDCLMHTGIIFLCDLVGGGLNCFPSMIRFLCELEGVCCICTLTVSGGTQFSPPSELFYGNELLD